MKSNALILALLLPLAAHAGEGKGVNAEIRGEMAAARKEVRQELAQARKELDTGNLEVGRDSFNLGKRDDKRDGSLPKAEITPAGDFLLDGKAVAINAKQREGLLAYRGMVIDLAKAGIDIGERSAQAALEAVGDTSLFGLMFGGISGSLERKVERLVKETVEPAVHRICQRLPEVYASQQQLAASLPEFEPYASLDPDDIDDCERDVRDSFVSN